MIGKRIIKIYQKQIYFDHQTKKKKDRFLLNKKASSMVLVLYLSGLERAQ